MSAQHTPGPWEAGHHRMQGMVAIYAGRDQVALVGSAFARDGKDEDVSLIAAAPDLFEALRDLLQEWDALGFGDDEGRPVQDKHPSAVAARAAIAKATGGAS